MIARRARVALVLGVLLCAAACGRRAPAPSILLITINGLRADVVGATGGEKGLTPNLDALAQGASWAGRAVSTSSASAPAVASILTGLRPWQHQLLYDGGVLARHHETLANALGRAGYRTAAFTDQRNLRRANGLAQGFEVFLAGPARAEEEIARDLGEHRPFLIWVHFDLVGEGYRRHDAYLDRLRDAPPGLPAGASRAEIEAWYDPSTPMPAAERARLWALYRTGVAEVDQRVGTLLQALRQGGRLDEAMVVVASDAGEEFGDYGQSGHGGSLGRALIEVPLIVKLPHAGAPENALHVPAEERVSTARVAATVLSQAGVAVPPGLTPGLAVRLAGTAESELYLGNGTNTFSLVEGDLQLVRTVPFAAPEPGYFAARRALLEPDRAAALPQPPQAIFNRQAHAFRLNLPWTGVGAAQERLLRWLPDGTVQEVADASASRRLAAALAERFFFFVPEELTPAEARRRR